jgi:hypothetical protein
VDLSAFFYFFIYQHSGNGCGKAIVDINGRNTCRAAIEHSQ